MFQQHENKAKREWEEVTLPTGTKTRGTKSQTEHPLTPVSVSIAIEIQAAYIAQLIQAMARYDIPVLEPKPEPTERWNAWLDKRAAGTVWCVVVAGVGADGQDEGAELYARQGGYGPCLGELSQGVGRREASCGCVVMGATWVPPVWS